MSLIYNIDFSLAAERLSPPAKRKSVYLAWLKALLAPLQWFRFFVFGSYANGINASYLSDTQYAYGDIVKYDGLVYMNIASGGSMGVDPPGETAWLLLLDTDIGLLERLKYNGQTIVLEGVLNRIITGNHNPSPAITIENVSNDKLITYFYNQIETSSFKDAPVFYKGLISIPPDPAYPDNAVFLYYETEYVEDFDFIVSVPPEYYRENPVNPEPPNFKNIALITTYVEKYKIVGTTYNIQEKIEI
jgi:hypothetical protein